MLLSAVVPFYRLGPFSKLLFLNVNVEWLRPWFFAQLAHRGTTVFRDFVLARDEVDKAKGSLNFLWHQQSLATSSAAIYRCVRLRLHLGHPPPRSGFRSMNPTGRCYSGRVGEHCNPEFGPPVTFGTIGRTKQLFEASTHVSVHKRPLKLHSPRPTTPHAYTVKLL